MLVQHNQCLVEVVLDLYNIIGMDITVICCFDRENYIITKCIIPMRYWASLDSKGDYETPNTGTIFTIGN